MNKSPKFKKTLVFFNRFRFPIILIGIWLLICIANFSPNTFLTGWDNLHPELNYSMNLKRLLTSSWAEYQGLGAPGAHSHAAEIPRMVIVGILNLFLETNLIRYVFVFSTLLIGSLGIYFLVKGVFLRKKDKNLRDFSAFAASLFYMLNVGTVQHYVAPFEMFNVQFALLPWLILLAIRYLDTKKYKYLLYFAVVTFFAAPMAYAVMLWIAYFGGLTIFITLNAIFQRKKDLIKPSIFIIAVTLFVNLFWLVPNLYFVFNHSDYVPTAKTNLIFSEEAFLTNQKYGNPVDIFLNKGFLFDWQIRNPNYTFEPIMGKWDTHMDNPIVLSIALLCFALIILGILYSIYKRQKYLVPLVGVLAFAGVIIMGTNPPFGDVWDILISRISVLQEAIRFPFTKFSILFIFAQASFLAIGVYVVAKFLSSRVKFQFGYVFALLFLLLISFVYALPSFQGSFINKSLRLDIPKDYFELFNYFNDQDKSERIANFPVNTLFGWFYTDWGYQGSGFLWYGIEQPILDRDFDRWYTTLENYYDEISSAVYTNDSNALRDVFKQYAIDWIVIDEHVTSSSEDNNYSLNPNLASSEMAYRETKTLLDQIPEAQLAATFGKIHVYKISGLDTDREYIDVLNVDTSGDPIEEKSIFLEDNFGRKTKESYIERNNIDYVSYYNNVYTLSNDEAQLIIPQIYDVEQSVPATVIARKVSNTISIRLNYQIPTISVNNKEILNVAKVHNISFDVNETSSNFYLKLNNQSIFLENIDSAWQNFGNADISTTVDLVTKLYDVDEGDNITTRLDLEDASINNCNAQQVSRSSSTTYDNGILSFRSTGENICIDFSISALGTVNSLYKLDFEYRSNQGVVGDACIKFSDGCENTKGVRSDYLPTFWYPFSTLASDENSNRVGLSLVFNNGTPENTASLSYRNIKFFRYDLVDSVTVSADEIKNDLELNNNVIGIKPIDTKIAVKFTLPINRKYNFDYSALQQVIPLAPKDCKPYVPSLKLDRSLDSQNKQIIFESIDGFNCENINLYNLDLKNGFMINLEGENRSGPGLVLNVSDFYYRKVYYTNRLAEDSEFDEFLTIPNLIESPANGLNLFINNQSVGSEETINTLKSISISPIIYNWLSAIRFESIPNYISDQTVVNVEKLTTTNYFASIGASDKDRILKFNQSYESNWLAYDNKGNLLKRSGNQNSNTEKAEWNNYWILPAGVSGVFIEYRTQTYQYFAYLIVGLLFALLTLASVWQSDRFTDLSKKIKKKFNKIARKRDLFVERRVEPKLDKYKKFNRKDI